MISEWSSFISSSFMPAPGSSNRSSFLLPASARAISTSLCWPYGKSTARSPGPVRQPDQLDQLVSPLKGLFLEPNKLPAPEQQVRHAHGVPHGHSHVVKHAESLEDPNLLEGPPHAMQRDSVNGCLGDVFSVQTGFGLPTASGSR